MIKFNSILIALAMIIGLSIYAKAESKKMVFVEEYSSAYCGTCGYFAPTFKSVGKSLEDEIIPVTIATGNGPGDPFYRHKPTNSSRVGLYVNGSYGTPAVWVDGEKVEWNQYQGNIGNYIGGMSPITIYPIEDRSTPGKLKIKTIVQSDEELSSNHQLFVFVIENDITYQNAGSNGQTEFTWMTRDIRPGGRNGVNLSIPAGGLQSYEVELDISDEWDMENISVVAIVQDMNNLEVLQAARTLQDVSGIVPEIASSVDEKLDFGDVTDLKTEKITITNTGLDDLVIEDIYLLDQNMEEFEILNQGDMELAPGETNDITIQFFPKENGSYVNELIIESNATNEDELIIRLTGQATNIVPFGEITFDDDRIDFGDVTTEKTIEWEITNTGTGPLMISSIAISEESNSEGAYQLLLENNMDITLEKDGSLMVPIKFTPFENEKYYFSDLIILSDSKNNSELEVALRGKGFGIEDKLELSMIVDGESTNTVDFGTVSTSDPVVKNIEMTNTGNQSIEVTNVLLSSDGNPNYKQFSLTGNTAFTLEGGQKEDIEVTFTPAEDEDYRGKILVFSRELDPITYYLAATLNLSSVYDKYLEETGILTVSINPNPVEEVSTIQFNYDRDVPENIDINIFDVNGNFLGNIYSQEITRETHTATLNSDIYNAGSYFLSFELMGKKLVKQIKIVK